MGNYNAQQSLANLKYPEQYGIVVGTFPYDKQMDWTIREFGPLPIPQKGQTVKMNRTNCLLYRQLIGWEQKKKLRIKDGQIVLGDSVIAQYRFKRTIILFPVIIWLTRRIRDIGGCCRKNTL